MLNRGENRTRDLGVTSPHALPSELHIELSIFAFPAIYYVHNTQFVGMETCPYEMHSKMGYHFEWLQKKHGDPPPPKKKKFQCIIILLRTD